MLVSSDEQKLNILPVKNSSSTKHCRELKLVKKASRALASDG